MLEDLKKITELTSIKESNTFYQSFFKKEDIINIFRELKENELFSFDQLIDITAIDYPSKENRFELIYILLSMKKNKRIILKTLVNENDSIDSIIQIFKASDWYERECYDLFGIKFNNHPDLRRIMTDYNFEGHPLRKDFPLTGHLEVRYSEEEKKVIKEPVKLEQNYRNFDYESPWEGTKYIKEQTDIDDKKN